MAPFLARAGHLHPEPHPAVGARGHVVEDIDRGVTDCRDDLACFGLVEAAGAVDPHDDLTHMSLNHEDTGSEPTAWDEIWMDGRRP